MLRAPKLHVMQENWLTSGPGGPYGPVISVPCGDISQKCGWLRCGRTAHKRKSLHDAASGTSIGENGCSCFKKYQEDTFLPWVWWVNLMWWWLSCIDVLGLHYSHGYWHLVCDVFIFFRFIVGSIQDKDPWNNPDHTVRKYSNTSRVFKGTVNHCMNQTAK